MPLKSQFGSFIVKLGTALLLFFEVACNNVPSKDITAADAKKILEGLSIPGSKLIFWSYRRVTSSGNNTIALTERLAGIYKTKDSAFVQLFEREKSGLKWAKTASYILSGADTLNRKEWVTLSGHSWLYLEYLAADTAAKKGSVYFDLLNPDSGKMYQLIYTYSKIRQQDQGSFKKQNLDSLRSTPLVLAYLQQKASSSDLIPSWDNKTYLPNKDAALRKWAMLNEGVYEALNDNESLLRLNVEEYLTDITKNDTASEGLAKPEVKVEDGAFKVVCHGAGPVYVYSKQSKHSFLIWAPADSSSQVKNLKLRNNTLSISPRLKDTLTKGYTIEIDLLQKTVKKVVTPVPGAAKVASVKNHTHRTSTQPVTIGKAGLRKKAAGHKAGAKKSARKQVHKQKAAHLRQNHRKKRRES